MTPESKACMESIRAIIIKYNMSYSEAKTMMGARAHGIGRADIKDIFH